MTYSMKVPAAEAYQATEATRELRGLPDLACRNHDPELFMLEGADERSPAVTRQINAAKKVCEVCPALLTCREAALGNYDPWSILGGMSPREREDIRAERGLTAPRVRKPARPRDHVKEATQARARRAERAAANRPGPRAAEDPAVVHAFYAGRLLWIRTTEADRVLLFATLRDKGWSMHTVAARLNVSHQKVAEYWQVAA